MQGTNNELSTEELRTINDADFFKLKSEITHKIEAGLAVLGEDISAILQHHADHIPHDVLKIAPKISQGERYLGLPWLILDYPRIFTGEDVFAFRSMFWWGNYFSFTIHVSGKYLKAVKRKLADNISMLHHKDFYLCINKDQWQHHFEESNYLPLDKLQAKETASVIRDAEFIKLGRKLSLNSFAEMTEYGAETYKEFLNAISR